MSMHVFSQYLSNDVSNENSFTVRTTWNVGWCLPWNGEEPQLEGSPLSWGQQKRECSSWRSRRYSIFSSAALAIRALLCLRLYFPCTSLDPYPGPRGFLLILSFFILKFATRSADWSAESGEKESLWSRPLRISLSCWFSTRQLSKMSFSLDQSQRGMGFTICWQGRVGQVSGTQK